MKNTAKLQFSHFAPYNLLRQLLFFLHFLTPTIFNFASIINKNDDSICFFYPMVLYYKNTMFNTTDGYQSISQFSSITYNNIYPFYHFQQKCYEKLDKNL